MVYVVFAMGQFYPLFVVDVVVVVVVVVAVVVEQLVFDFDYL